MPYARTLLFTYTIYFLFSAVQQGEPAGFPIQANQLRRILSKKFRLSRDDAASAMEPVHEATSQIIEHDLKVIDIFRDTYDDNILACAVAAKAEYLVTGDVDLPEIKIYKQVV